MRVYVCKDFKGHYPVGTAAVICANDAYEARRLLSNELERVGLVQPVEKLTLKEIIGYGCTILCDGNY
jgi:hypothetical protein